MIRPFPTKERLNSVLNGLEAEFAILTAEPVH